MASNTGKEPAFPCVNEGCLIDNGLTKREYFAGLAMQGELACQSVDIGEYLTDKSFALLAKRACAIADALLAELEKANVPK